MRKNGRDLRNRGLVFSNICTIIIYLLFAGFGLEVIRGSLLFPDSTVELYGQRLAATLLGGLGGTVLILLLVRISDSVSSRLCLFILSVFCLAVKLSWVLAVRIEPDADYKTFFDTAVNLSQNLPLDNARYIALFPHIFGYSGFLSLLMKLFGTSELVPPVINTVLSLASMVLIYHIAQELIGKRGAVTASLIWIFLPSQTMYNMFCLSEPLYTCGILLSIALMVWIWKNRIALPPAKLMVAGAMLGILLRFINMTRPIAAILLIAFFIWLFVICWQKLASMATRRKLIVFITAAAIYAVTAPLSSWLVQSFVGERPAGIPGYNICVGFNQEAKGMWNLEDSGYMSYLNEKSGWTAEDVQNTMFGRAIERIQFGGLDFGKLFYDKFHVLWGNDSNCVSYAVNVLENDDGYRIACDAFYYAVVLLACAGAVIAAVKKERSALAVAVLYIIGLTLAQMLVEVAGRYHYSGLIAPIFLAAYCLEALYSALFHKRRAARASSL